LLGDDLILMVRVLDRPSRLKSISIPNVRSNGRAGAGRPRPWIPRKESGGRGANA
jgi:hypothetical protein